MTRPTRAGSDSPTAPRVTVVIGTRDRRANVLGTLARLAALPDQPPIILVDDASTDGTAAAVRAAHPSVRILEQVAHRGVTAARNNGVRAAATPYVAFADDDSWWASGALTRAADLLDAHPRLGLVAARILVGDDERLDPACTAMAASPLPGDDLPGPKVLGFVACGAVVRRSAYLAVGGFPEDYVIGGEEEPLALALAAGGWAAAYAQDVVAHHAPGGIARDTFARDRNWTRNDLWTAWRHRRLLGAVRRTLAVVRTATTPGRRRGVVEAVRRLPSVLGDRRPVPPHVEAERRLLEVDDGR